MFERSGINLMASNQISAQTRVQVLLEYVHEKDMDFEELAEVRRTRLQQIIQLVQLQNEANQVRVFLVFPTLTIQSPFVGIRTSVSSDGKHWF